ncbi:MAG: tetratricopeptide repeat protein [Myxococcales bacterium]|nr:tetratricopeptide repeat protein [Myxococcales bacterium]
MSPDDREKLLQEAQKHVEKGRKDKAAPLLARLVAEAGDDVRTVLRVGDLYSKLNSHEEAIATYERVGDHYYREGFSVKAIAVYKNIRGIIKRHAPFLEGRYGHVAPRLAEIYTQLGLTSDALSAYDEVATRLRGDGRERDALDIFQKILDLDPQNPIAHLRVADSRARLGDMERAVTHFGDAAKIMLKLGRHDDALKVLERLLEYRQDPDYARMAAELYLGRGQPNDAMAALHKLQISFKANPKDLTTLAALARAFDAINQPKKAIEVLKESARIAKEKGRADDLNAILDTLLERAPEDTVVKQLDAQRRLPSAPPQPSDAVLLSEADIEEADIAVLEESISDAFEMKDGEVVSSTRPGAGAFAEDADEPSGARRLAQQAEGLRAAGKLRQAIATLRDGLRQHKGARGLRHKLSDLLLEAGDQPGSIREKLLLAQQLAKEGAVEGALGMLDEVLLLQPGNADAVSMRAALGAPPDAPGSAHGPLVSYDVEAGGVAEALSRSDPSASAIELDDPFAGEDTAARLPQPAQHAAPAFARPTGTLLLDPEQAASLRSVAQLDEEALDQADYLAIQGRFDEARAILQDQLRQLPDHPLILERLADVDGMAAGASAQSGPHPVGTALGAETAAAAAPAPPPEKAAAAPAAHKAPHANVYEEVGEIIEQFRAGVRQQVADTDAATHYDLGVAYNEMGLHQDAINELSLAARDLGRECVALSMIGMVYLQLGDYDGALDSFSRALSAEQRTADQEIVLGYEIGNTYELKQANDLALQFFEWVASIAPDYQDPRGTVTNRIARLRGESGAQRKPGLDLGDADDLDGAFNDAFKR